MGNRIKELVTIAAIVALGFTYQYKYIDEFPSHIHAWAQSDRYALALGFVDNGLNFFKPQTFVYNHQFPDNWTVPSEETVTAVDFPIHDYIPALVMKISGNTSPWIFRIYILLYSFLGLYFLFRLSLAVTGDYSRSVFVVVFAATSPVYVYYQGGFLPTIPSLSNAVIGIYFYYRYAEGNSNKHFRLSILFLTLASLARTTFAIPLIAVLAVEFLRLLKKETNLVPKLIPVGLSIVSILFYLLYNGYLRETYGSIFLSHILPPDSMGQAKEIIKQVFQNWFFQYFTGPHYFVFIALILLSVSFIAIRLPGIPKAKAYFGLLTAACLVGSVIFAFLMLRQFPAHDYYFLDTFFLPFLMFLILVLSFIPVAEKRNLRVITVAAAGILSLVLILQPIKSQEKRRETGYWDKTEATILNFENSAAFLDSAGIPGSAKMLVMDAVAPNIPFILMERKGFAVMNASKENMEDALAWDYDYIVVQNEYFIPDIYTPYPAVLSKLNKVADNGRITVCTLSAGNQQSLLDFMGLTGKRPVFEKSISFENEPDSSWQNFNPSDRYAHSGMFSGHLAPDIVYGLTFSTKHLPELRNRSRTLFFSSYFLKESATECEMVASINSNGKNIYYRSYNLDDLIKQAGTWEEVPLLFQLPEVRSDDYELAIYLWNTGKADLYYDDFGFSIY